MLMVPYRPLRTLRFICILIPSTIVGDTLEKQLQSNHRYSTL